MLKKLIYRIEIVIAVFEAIYDKYKDWIKLAFSMLLWYAAYDLILNVTYELPLWPMFAGLALIALLFSVYKHKKSYKKLLILCSVPFFGVFPLVFFGDFWVACIVIMTYFYTYFCIFRPYDKNDIQLVIYNRIVFSVYVSMVGVLLICTVFLSILSLPFTFMGYYKLKWTIKSYKQINNIKFKILRVIMAIPVFIGCVMLMFMSSL